MVLFNLCLRKEFCFVLVCFLIGQKRWDVGGGSDALIGNLCVNAKGHVPQLVLDGSIKILVANSWLEEVGLPVSCRQNWFPAAKHYSKYLSYCFASEGSQQRTEHNTLSTENLKTLLILLILWTIYFINQENIWIPYHRLRV